MSAILDTFRDVYNRLNKDTLALIDQVYSEEILFIDPLHRVVGLKALHDYFERLYAGVVYCRFHFEDEVVQEGKAMVTWTSELELRHFRKGEILRLPGATLLRFTDKVNYHRDYFDVGAMI